MSTYRRKVEDCTSMKYAMVLNSKEAHQGNHLGFYPHEAWSAWKIQRCITGNPTPGTEVK